MMIDAPDRFNNGFQRTDIHSVVFAMYIKISARHLLEQVCLVLNDTGEGRLTAAQGITHHTQLALALIINGNVQIALRKSDQGALNLGNRNGDGLNNYESQRNDRNRGNHRNQSNDSRDDIDCNSNALASAAMA